MQLVKRLFAWWDGVTLGVQWTVFQRARHVGSDDYGNRYFEERRVSLDGRKRRYVIYKGYADASRVPADWHGWLHHTFEQPPTLAPLARKAWETEHRPNLTGTVHAYHPKGSLARPEARARSDGDYEAWTPGES